MAGICDVVQPAVPRPRALERPRPDPQGADVRADRTARATTARTSRSTGGTSTRRPATPGCAGATTTRRPRSRTSDLVAENARRAQARPRVRAARHRRLRRRPLLDRRGRLRQGRPDTTPDADHRHERRPRRGHAARAADALVPQHLVLGRRRAAAGAASRGRRSIVRRAHPSSGDYALRVGAGPDGAAPELLFCENETNVARLFGAPPTTPYPKDGINDHVVAGADDGEPGADRHEGRRVVPGHGPAGRRRPSSGCGCEPSSAGSGRRPRRRRDRLRRA